MESKEIHEPGRFTQWLVLHCSVVNRPKTEWLKTTFSSPGFGDLGRGWWGQLIFVPQWHQLAHSLVGKAVARWYWGGSIPS